MEFCPKCGSVLVKKKTKYGCANPKCNYVAKEDIKITAKEHMPNKKYVTVMKDKEGDVWPVTATTCPKCGHNEAYFWSAQMRAGDEAETRFFRCTKCKHTWREYR